MADYEELVYKVEDGVATVTLSRPHALNAFTPQMGNELLRVLDEVDQDDDVRVLVMTGSGRAFCAGADLSSGGDTFDVAAHAVEITADTYEDIGGIINLRLFRCLKPVIAAINGPAVGFGATLTLPMDVRLASTSAKFGFVFARRGISLDGCASYFLPRTVGISRAQEWVLSGRIFGADAALEAGLVRGLHAPDELLPAAHELAREIADNTSPVSVALVRQQLWQALGYDGPERSMRLESRLLFHRGMQPDAHEGVTSFLEKRLPRFPMKVSSDLPGMYPFD